MDGGRTGGPRCLKASVDGYSEGRLGLCRAVKTIRGISVIPDLYQIFLPNGRVEKRRSAADFVKGLVNSW